MSTPRILVVEDDLIVGLDLQHRLEDMGYEVLAVVATGLEAIEQAKTVTPDLVLMDIKLSGDMDGVEAAERIRENLDVPVVFVTAFADEPTTTRIKAIAPYGYVVKPFQKGALRAVIESALTRAEMVNRLRASEHALAEAHQLEKKLRARLEAVDRAGMAISRAALSSLDMREFLQVVVNEARTLVDAEYAALGLGGAADQPFESWVFSGMSVEQSAAVGRFPRPVGVLGAVVEFGAPIRLADVHDNQLFRGFPPHHPEMKSFLGVPLRHQGKSHGNLYLADRRGLPEFTDEDQQTIEMLAERVSVALEIARLVRQVEARERTRIEFLANASRVLSESLDHGATLNAIGDLIVPSIADMCVVELTEAEGRPREVVVRYVDPEKQTLLQQILVSLPEFLPELTEDLLDEAVHDPSHRDLLRQISVSVPISLRGQTFGVLRLGTTDSRDRRDGTELPFLGEIAHIAAIAIENARLYEATKQKENEQRFLAEVGSTLASTLDYRETLEKVGRLAVRDLADWCLMDLVDRAGKAHRQIVHRSAAKAPLCEALARIPIDRCRPHLTSAVLETNRPVVVSEVDATYLESIAQSEEELRALRDLEPRSIMAVPLHVRERLIGVCVLVSSNPARRYRATDLSLARKMADQSALAIENAQLYQVARYAIQDRDDVMAIVSHDLTNPLNAIRLSVELLLRALPPGERGKERKHLEVINRSSARLEQLIKSLRDASMIETGQFTVEPKPEDVPSLVTEATAMLEPQAERQGLKVDVELADDLPTIPCDRMRVLQVLGNLVGNAIKFTESGGRIRIAVRSSEEAVCFSVSDTGAGIPDHQMPHIFERYWKGKERRKNVQGTGLGLYIAKAIVESHGGTIWAESKVGEGTSFFFTLPFAPPASVRVSENGPELPQ
jgi:signal transduction histidine kinase/CheY-like chemotaxis protein